MISEKSPEYLVNLLAQLISLPLETEWVEFKGNNYNPLEIGEYLSALSNSAALADKAASFLAWGIDDKTHEVIGTSFHPRQAKEGNEELENWLLHLITPQIPFCFYEFSFGNKPVVLLEIGRASHRPTQFKGVEYIRVGSYKKKLKEHPEHERRLWRVFDQTSFEEQNTSEHMSASDVLSALDFSRYFDLLSLPIPSSQSAILDKLSSDNLVHANLGGGWGITNLGALLFAKNLDDFRKLGRKAVRIVLYKGNDRLVTVYDKVYREGYASGFEHLIDLINTLLPGNEVIGKALRESIPPYPHLAIRELLVNALVHQDFSISGTGPLVEIFTDRMEITNPGSPLTNTDRFLDAAPRSRNEGIAALMRRLGFCEERGSGIDKVVAQCEQFQLPAPLFEITGEATRVVLFSHKPFNAMSLSDRVRACYLHACLKYVERNPMTNSSLRTRFGIAEKNSAIISRIIRDSMDDGKIKPFDPNQGKKYARYVPFWT